MVFFSPKDSFTQLIVAGLSSRTFQKFCSTAEVSIIKYQQKGSSNFSSSRWQQDAFQILFQDSFPISSPLPQCHLHFRFAKIRGNQQDRFLKKTSPLRQQQDITAALAPSECQQLLFKNSLQSSSSSRNPSNLHLRFRSCKNSRGIHQLLFKKAGFQPRRISAKNWFRSRRVSARKMVSVFRNFSQGMYQSAVKFIKSSSRKYFQTLPPLQI